VAVSIVAVSTIVVASVAAVASVVEDVSVAAVVLAVSASVSVDLVVLVSVSVLFNWFGFWETPKNYIVRKESAPASNCAAGALLYYVYHIGQKIVHKLVVRK
jgi:hypothetical protein